jgi:hypothetical protein
MRDKTGMIVELTEEQLDAIAERAADKAAAEVFKIVYAEIGRNVVSKFLYILGAALIAFAGWLSGHSGFKL